jgi:hypothetical protein
MRKQFDIKYRPQIESGEYKVETRDGRKARIIHWDLNCTSPIVAVMDAHIDLPGEIVDVFSVSGRAFDDLESPSDLFIVTPEPELSEFEKRIRFIIDEVVDGRYNADNIEDVKGIAKGLLELARDQFIKDGYVIEKKAFHDAVENISDKNLAEMSVEYSLHCKIEDGTRHAIMNWEAFQKVAQKFIDVGKAEALKDLPWWKKSGPNTGQIILYKGSCNEQTCLYAGGYKIMLSDLEKLPKEDSHE